MAQKEEQGYGAMDPFGQFLMAAYLKGMVPGSQTSAYNTVLDLLSPGAVAGRQEAGVPDVAEQFANMFGGMNLAPAQIGQMQEQTAGLRLTPGQESAERTALNKAMADIIARRGTGREAAQIGADVEREKIPFLKQKTEAELGEIEARTGMYGRSGKVDYSDPRVQAAMFDNNIKSLATSGRHWDHTTGKPSEEMADPKEVAAAQALLNVGQQGDLGAMMLRVLPTMLASNDTEQNELGKQMWKDLTGYWYDDTGIKMFGRERGVVRPGELGGKAQAENVESVKARIQFMEDLMLTMGIDDPETRAEINRMKESIGMPTEEPVRTRGPMDYK